MITIDKLEAKIEKLNDAVKSLNFAFKDAALEKEGEDLKETILGALEEYFELASEDWDKRGESENDEEST